MGPPRQKGKRRRIAIEKAARENAEERSKLLKSATGVRFMIYCCNKLL